MFPGLEGFAVSWTNASGNFWLFGGFGFGSAASDTNVLNDLWKYSAGEWTWMSGANVVSQPGTYGTLGTAAPGNVPGARYYSVGWTDASGNFWLFGGIGVDSNGSDGSLNDLWKYSAGEWTWMGGSNVVNQAGTYGTHGTAASSNVPGARYYSVGWTDASGNLWLWVGLAWTRPGTADNSTICGSTVRANGRGWVGRTWPTKQGPTELKGRLPPATFLGRDLQVLVGLTRPEICGSSVEAVTTRPGQPVGSTTCGSTSPNHTHLMRLMMGSSDRFSIKPTSRPDAPWGIDNPQEISLIDGGSEFHMGLRPGRSRR